ncbi:MULTISPECIES: C39 family peptidase [unclassified Micromonospora]|uniref:C39 family peptidase n=1 Tax=unclassified Micromonospora TaxID=2617518 RepID=UPI0010333AEE|nr:MULTISPECIES: C39 family peptidase [unclassified Micromonospora]QKW16601.1 C39 family peptidase [Verrucosispora sp. NA02020]TBL34692.1 phytochelatin synthase [Verrucosispora sp. SN26_14.1]
MTMTTLMRKAALTAAGAVCAGGMISGPMAAVGATNSTDALATVTERGHGKGERQLKVRYQAQPNFYYCGPAAVRNALSVMDKDVSQDDLAREMGTTERGTDSAFVITKALNNKAGKDVYRTVEIPGQVADEAETERLREDIVRTVDDDRSVVANVFGTAVDLGGGSHSFESGHYISVTGYRDGGSQVKIADSADPAKAEYWMDTEVLADWIASRGYSA